MAVTTTVNRTQYNGDDATVAFSVPLYFLANTWIKATLTSAAGADTAWTEGVDYTLTGATVAAGGTLTATTPPATGERLTIYREAPYNQLTTYEYSGSFPADANEDTVDKNTILIQQVRELADTLAITFPQTEPTGTANILPEFDARKGKYIYFTDAGVLTTGTLTGSSLLDEDDMATDSATEGASQQSIKAYVDTSLDPAQTATAVTRSDTTTPSTNIPAWGSSNGVLEDGYSFLDEDDMTSDSATGLASQQSIKAYAARQPASTTEDNIPQWDATTGELKDGLDFLDEDDLTSDSATALASQQSIKAYVDSRAHLPTGTPIPTFLNATPDTGFVFMVGRTISDAGQGGTERANADCEALFTYLYDNLTDSEAPVSGGRAGGSAATDWANGESIVVPNMQGQVMLGKDNGVTGSSRNLVTDTEADTMGDEGGSASTSTSVTIPDQEYSVNTGLGSGHDGFVNDGADGQVGYQGSPVTITNGSASVVQPFLTVNYQIKL